MLPTMWVKSMGDSEQQIKAAAATVGLALKKTSMYYLKLVSRGFLQALLAYRAAKGGLRTFGEEYFEPPGDGGRFNWTAGSATPGVCAPPTPAA